MAEIHVAVKLPLKKAEVFYLKNFLSEKEANELLEYCTKNLNWRDYKVKVYGKEFNQPRKSCMLGKSYKYSGYVRKADPMPEIIQKLQDRIEAECKKLYPDHPSLNGCLCNYYADGNNYIGPHSDDEKDLDKSSFIIGLSIGAVRHFDLLPKYKEDSETKEEKYRIDLANGSLIFMGKECQKNYKHTVPKQMAIKTPRINMTFRVLKRD